MLFIAVLFGRLSLQTTFFILDTKKESLFLLFLEFFLYTKKTF